MSDGIIRLLEVIPVFLFSLCFHEFAHAWMAVRRGDPTPQLAGRLTMHPMAHADMVGTLVLPSLCLYFGWPFFGWARPVPVDVGQLKRGRKDMALVAAAGPAANIVLALISTAALALLFRISPVGEIWVHVRTFTILSIQINLMLAIFNLLPLPPLDGFNVLQGFLSSSMALRVQRLGSYTDLILLVLLVSGGLSVVGKPALFGFRYLVGLAAQLGGVQAL